MNERMVLRTAMRSMGEPEDVAALVVFLASPEARYITGQVIHVGAGSTSSSIDRSTDRLPRLPTCHHRALPLAGVRHRDSDLRPGGDRASGVPEVRVGLAWDSFMPDARGSTPGGWASSTPCSVSLALTA